MEAERLLDAGPDFTPLPSAEELLRAKLSPEQKAEYDRQMAASARRIELAANLYRRSIKAEQTGQFRLAAHLYEQAELLYDQGSINSTVAENMLRRLRRRQRIQTAAAFFTGRFRRPQFELGHDAAAEALPPAVENG